MSEPVSSSVSVEELAEEFLERQRQGQRPTVAEYLERYPHLAEEIQAFFPTLGLIEAFKPRSPRSGSLHPASVEKRFMGPSSRAPTNTDTNNRFAYGPWGCSRLRATSARG
jgi:hypothetical protein